MQSGNLRFASGIGIFHANRTSPAYPLNLPVCPLNLPVCPKPVLVTGLDCYADGLSHLFITVDINSEGKTNDTALLTDSLNRPAPIACLCLDCLLMVLGLVDTGDVGLRRRAFTFSLMATASDYRWARTVNLGNRPDLYARWHRRTEGFIP